MKAINIEELELNHANENTELLEPEEKNDWTWLGIVAFALSISLLMILVIPWLIVKI
jgi:hypothetical protein